MLTQPAQVIPSTGRWSTVIASAGTGSGYGVGVVADISVVDWGFRLTRKHWFDENRVRGRYGYVNERFDSGDGFCKGYRVLRWGA